MFLDTKMFSIRLKTEHCSLPKYNAIVQRRHLQANGRRSRWSLWPKFVTKHQGQDRNYDKVGFLQFLLMCRQSLLTDPTEFIWCIIYVVCFECFVYILFGWGDGRNFFLQLCNGWTCLVVRTVVPHTKSANTACTKRSWWCTDEVRNM